MWSGNTFSENSAKILPTFQLTILTEKKLQIDSEWSETCKKYEIRDAEFLPVAGAGNLQLTNFPSREFKYKLP